MSLDAVRQSVTARDDAIRAAFQAGESAADIAKAAGLTRQRVYQLLGAETAWKRKAEKRLAELDQRYEALVDVLADGYKPPDSFVKYETAKRNGRRGIDARAGRPQRSTVLQQARAEAESKLLRTLADNPKDPRIITLLAEIDEANAIRQKLEAGFDRSLGITD